MHGHQFLPKNLLFLSSVNSVGLVAMQIILHNKYLIIIVIFDSCFWLHWVFFLHKIFMKPLNRVV